MKSVQLGEKKTVETGAAGGTTKIVTPKSREDEVRGLVESCMPLWRVVPSSGVLEGSGATLSGSIMVAAGPGFPEKYKYITLKDGAIEKPGFDVRTPWCC